MECDNGNDAPNLTNSHRKHRKKSLQKTQDTGLGTSATVDKNMSNLNGEEVQVLKKVETTIGETSSGTNVTDNTELKKRKRKKTKESNQDAGGILSTRESTQEGLSKTTTADANMLSKELDYTTEVANGKEDKREKKANLKNKRLTLAEILNPHCSESLEAVKGEPGSGTTSTDSQASKKQKRRKSNKNADLGDAVSTCESTHEGLRTTKVLEVKSGETVSAKAATSDANMMSKEQDHTEVANGKEPNPKNKQATLAEILNPHNLQNMEALKDEEKGSGSGSASTDNPVSKKQKRKLSKKSYSSDILSTDHESKQEVLSTAKVLEPVVSKGDHSEVASGKLDESVTTNNGNDAPKLTKLEKKNRRALKKKLNANLGYSEKTEDIENPNSKPEAQFYSNTGIGTSVAVDNKTSMSFPASTVEMDSSMTTNLHGEVDVQRKVETSSGTTARDDTALKKRKREKKKNNPDLGDISSTRENTQEGSSTTIVLEVKNDETASDTAIPDANMVSKEQDHTEVANGKKKRKRKPKSENTLPTLGENLDPMYLPNMEAAVIPASKEQKGQTINNNPASGDICENTSKAVEAVSDGVSQGEKHMKDGIGTMSLTARTNLNVTGVRKEETKPKGSVKKLLILDVNGLLADVLSDRPKDFIADKYMHGRAIFKRPYLDDFLRFCLERFHVAIWSSRTWKKLDPLVYFLVRDLRWKLLFVWLSNKYYLSDRCQCLNSCIDTLEVKHKSIVMKDLRKIWDEDGPNNKWVKGTFNESNTLLVDDSPYKGLLNPKYTGIFPASYSYKNSDDNFLGPEGELQPYLEGLAAADDVRTYVAQHPFGQGAIDEQSPHWEFYSTVLERLNNETLMKRLLKKNRWLIKKMPSW
ncbi:uncharacterized protein LOC143593427 [Bidens hawaiensis]|uniref:uncharacterized protein LOC143593427 n=1 Tax=Bidens hawaiensis TaxID=980011 RepID=UPI0040498493